MDGGLQRRDALAKAHRVMGFARSLVSYRVFTDGYVKPHEELRPESCSVSRWKIYGENADNNSDQME